MIVFIAALGGFVLGFDAGVIVDGKDQISDQFSLSTFQWSNVTCVSILGALLAVPISGRAADKLGTKTMLIIAAFGFIIGLTMTATAYNLAQLIIGRFIVGICIGIASFCSPLFISEVAPPPIRGSMILLNGIAITTGQTISFLTGYFLHDISPYSWRFISWIEIIPAIGLLIGMLFIPKSPRWVASKYGIDRARTVLTKIRGGASQAVETELKEIEANIVFGKTKKCFNDIFSKKIIPVLLVGIGLGVLQQFVGINAIMYYGPVIFQQVGFHTIKSAIFATFCIGMVNLIFTIVSLFLVDYVGRRVLLLTGTLIAALSLFLVGYLSLNTLNGKWVMFFIATYIIGYCISLGSLFWVIISEIFPLNIRGRAMSFVTAMQCAANLIVSFTFLELFESLGKSHTFWLYGVMSLVAFAFIYYFVPETKGVSLELIESNLNAGKKLRKLGDFSISS